jgi:hypothetical protein
MLKYPPVSQQANETRQQAAVLRRTARIVPHQNDVPFWCWTRQKASLLNGE